MSRARASLSSREQRRRRSVAQLSRLLQQLQQPAEPMSTADALALREQIRQEAMPKQASLPLSPIARKDSPS
jgi:hypothetical protein